MSNQVAAGRAGSIHFRKVSHQPRQPTCSGMKVGENFVRGDVWEIVGDSVFVVPNSVCHAATHHNFNTSFFTHQSEQLYFFVAIAARAIT
jgi:hypothetical protein